MSDFVQQQNCICDFNSSDSWVILSPIEQSIKRKIEAVGTPLKDWDIQINYGIKTGFNDAFIISTEKRNEILANCKDADERQRTAELIRSNKFSRSFAFILRLAVSQYLITFLRIYNECFIASC